MTSAIANPPVFNVPGPAPAPLLGATLNIIQFTKDPIAYTRQLFEEYGNLVERQSLI